jgi:type VI secretion system protein ImpA
MSQRQEKAMDTAIDLDAVLAKFSGDNPSGADLRYDAVYEEIKEARRAEDPLTTGGSAEPKRSDWDKVVDLAVEALTTKTKDLQIAVWLTEALIRTEGFDGFLVGLRILTGYLENHWETVYPSIEEGDLEYRIGPLEFMNEKLWVAVKETPVTDPRVSDGYSLLKYEESRMVGSEQDLVGLQGNVDEGKRAKRDEMIAEGKLTAEMFNATVAKSPLAYYESLFEAVTACREQFDAFEKVVDEKFGKNAPRLTELRKAIEECDQFLKFRVAERRKSEPVASGSEKAGPSAGVGSTRPRGAAAASARGASASPGGSAGGTRRTGIADTAATEGDLWREALGILGTSGIKESLALLIAASNSAPSVRERNRLRLLMAKMCLKADRPDLCRPIVEELHALILELHLEKWESPLWIAEVLDTLYQSLTTREPSDEDLARARVLFQQMCTTDVTRAILYKG